MTDFEPSREALQALKPVETWLQDDQDPDLWHHACGLIVNSAALDERGTYYRLVRLHVGDGRLNNDGDALGMSA